MRKILPLLSILILTACGNPSAELKSGAGNAVQNWPCPSAMSLMYDVTYQSLADLQHIPTVKELVHAYELALKDKKVSFDQEAYLKQVENFYTKILEGADTSSVRSLLKHITSIEVGDQSEEKAVIKQQAMNQFKSQYQDFVVKNNGTCTTTPAPTPPTTTPPSTPPTPGTTISNPIVWGANKTMSVAYQSCSSIEKNPMNMQTPDVQGITKTGQNGAGYIRTITDLPALLRTDYYLQGQTRSSAACLDVNKSPLIYDYGGKPYATSTGRTLDLFTNSGSGGNVLGIDCSGFVYTSVTSAGLRLAPGAPIKPILVNGVSAAMYKNPSQNGLGCFSKISVGSQGTLRAGDVIAEDGHVVIVESTGADPLGITQAQSTSDCAALNSQNFDFTVIQSSSTKNGIGINKFIAKDFLQEDAAMKAGLEIYAREACKARLKGTNVMISGQAAQVVRHSQSANCVETPINLKAESCIAQCSMLL